MNENNNPFHGITDVGLAESLLNEYRRDNPDNLDGAREMLKQMLEVIIPLETVLYGDADDFHNLAVLISKISNDNNSAYTIVRKGLEIHTTNTDLLADALRYGFNTGEHEKCFDWYNKLQSIDRSHWSWRAYSFTIDYMMNVITSSYNNNSFDIHNIIDLAKEYQRQLPNEEDAWLSEQYIYENTNQRQKGVEVLENAIQIFDFCPKCSLRYADIMIDQGNYDKAEPIIRKMRRNPKTSESINSSYMFFLDGLCKMYRLISSEEYENGNINEKDLENVYRTFSLALNSPGLRENTKRRINEHLERLAFETGIPY